MKEQIAELTIPNGQLIYVMVDGNNEYWLLYMSPTATISISLPPFTNWTDSAGNFIPSSIMPYPIVQVAPLYNQFEQSFRVDLSPDNSIQDGNGNQFGRLKDFWLRMP